MTPFRVMCVCDNGVTPRDPEWRICRICDGLGLVWVPGAPSFGLVMQLGERAPGEIVLLGNGCRCKVLWHMPRKHPETTFVVELDDWDDSEVGPTISVPSVLGVASVAVPRKAEDDNEGDRLDAVDPLQRRAAARGALL